MFFPELVEYWYQLATRDPVSILPIVSTDKQHDGEQEGRKDRSGKA
jgi:hypothetical protein